MTTWWPYARLAAAILGIAAIVRQLTMAISNAIAANTDWGSDIATVVANFFSYFTILSNVLVIGTLVIGAMWTFRHRGKKPEPDWLAILFVCSTTYILITGCVYNLLLRGISIAGISDVWTNETLHVVMPLFMLVDLVLVSHGRVLSWRTVALAAVFPLAWVVYTMVRANFVTGPTTGDPWWYPYPFLDPHLVQGGYLGVVGYVVGIAVAIILVASGVVKVGQPRITRSLRLD